MLVVLDVPFFGGFLHATCSCTSLFPGIWPYLNQLKCRNWPKKAENVQKRILCMLVILEVPFFGRFAACNLFLHIIISCYMTRSESIKKPKRTGECRKCTEQDFWYARCIGSTIFRRVSACNLFLHIIVSCYLALFESIEKPKLARKGRKYTEQDSSYARCVGSTIIL
jgi:hypothetical protein